MFSKYIRVLLIDYTCLVDSLEKLYNICLTIDNITNTFKIHPITIKFAHMYKTVK